MRYFSLRYFAINLVLLCGKKILSTLVLILIIFALSSCRNNKVFEKHNDIENSIWNRIKYNNVQKFNIPFKDSIGNYNIFIAVRYSSIFPYTNLFVGLNIISPTGEERYSKIKLTLREKDGSMKGSGLGDLWDIKIQVLSNTTLNKAGIYKFYIENLMDKYETPGLTQIGLVIEKANK